jgi:hypothetical protein
MLWLHTYGMTLLTTVPTLIVSLANAVASNHNRRGEFFYKLSKVATKRVENMGSFKSGDFLWEITSGYVADSPKSLSLVVFVIVCVSCVVSIMNQLNIYLFLVVKFHQSGMVFSGGWVLVGSSSWYCWAYGELVGYGCEQGRFGWLLISHVILLTIWNSWNDIIFSEGTFLLFLMLK